MQYDQDLPLEEYIYTEALKERHEDLDRFKTLLAEGNQSNEENAVELLYVSKRLFYNQFGLEAIMESRQQMMNFLEIEVDDDTIPQSMSGTQSDEHDEKIEELLNALDDIEDLKKLKVKKLAQDYPEVPFFTYMRLILMHVKELATKRIMAQIEDDLSIMTEDVILKLEKDTLLARENKSCELITDNLVKEGSLNKLFNKRTSIHSFELMTVHTAIYEYLVSKNELLLLDAYMFATNALFPEWEDAWSDKELYSEVLKVEFCKKIIN
ncbi:hypothetical protein [Carboxylicivirga sp. N1Y90]|uniref:hypothetical protein n=1 Tax=Carboxylicivirga fragile TaxID=3417571 RepID=UPI003D3504D9|nr:hypothetical protein [Marinilabiliaceae bacterium N1Y90]